MPRALPASCARRRSEAFVLGGASCSAAEVGSCVAGLRWWRWCSTKAGPYHG
ncbi:hypothetical protein WMF11_06345 [Sorangium sp. So ce295]|uniref:hypothetical protein n=1 Tax=unclassified Sorangium TaxID=2621164 RepID=UPI003F5E0429